MIKINQEQKEARVQAAEEKQKKLIEKLSPEDKEKFRVVEEAKQNFIKAGVPCIMFPMLPSEYGVSAVWNYPCLEILEKYTPDGSDLTQESKDKILEYMDSLFSALFCTYVLSQIKSNTSEEKILSQASIFISDLMIAYQNECDRLEK